MKKVLFIICLFVFGITLFSFTSTNEHNNLPTDPEPTKCSASIVITISGLQAGCSVTLQSPSGVVATYSANGTYGATLAAPQTYAFCEYTGQSGQACDPNGIQVTWYKVCGANITGGNGTVSGPNCLIFELTCC